MVCQGTRKFVLMEVKKLGLKIKSFESDEIEFNRDLSQEETGQVIRSLNKYGLELVSRNNKNRDERITYQKSEPKIPVAEYNFMDENGGGNMSETALQNIYAPVVKE